MLVLALLMMVLAGGVAVALREAILKSSPQRLLLENFRGHPIPAIGGLVIIGPLLAAEALLALIALLRPGALDVAPKAVSTSAIADTFGSFDHLGLLLVAMGFFALGTLDDLAGAGQARGFKGHIRALREGVVTGGAIKAAGGCTIAFVAAAQWDLKLHLAVLDAAVVALSANFINLLDTRPGRAGKVFLAGWAPVAACAWATPYFPMSATVAVGSIVWMGADLAERGMLGDGGSNLLGAVLGAGLALSLSPSGRVAAAVVLLALTLASEKWSYGKAIERVPPLRWLDRLGRIPE